MASSGAGLHVEVTGNEGVGEFEEKAEAGEERPATGGGKRLPMVEIEEAGGGSGAVKGEGNCANSPNPSSSCVCGSLWTPLVPVWSLSGASGRRGGGEN